MKEKKMSLSKMMKEKKMRLNKMKKIPIRIK